MNITQESTGELTALVRIDIEKADYQNRVEEKLREHRKKMKMPGFREGKVPLGVVNKMYGKAILAEEINTIISEALQNHLDEGNQQTLASPLPNMEKQEQIDFDTQDVFSFWFDIALRPEVHIDLKAIEGIKLYEVEADEKSVKDYLDHIRKSFGTFEDTETIGEDDMVHCEMDEVNDAGEHFSGGIHSHGHVLIDKIADEEIRNRFMGASAGTVVRMNPMTAFQNRTEVDALLNLKVDELPEPLNDFDFEITKVSRRIPAPIDEKLLAEVFPEDHLQNEEELTMRVKKDIAASYAKEAEAKMFNDTLDALLHNSGIALPDAFMKRWLLENDEEGKSTPEEIEEHYDTYARQLKIALIRNRLIDVFNLHVTEDDFQQYIFKALGMDGGDENMEEARKMTVQSILGNILKDKKQSEKIGERIMEEKIASVILGEVPFTRESVTVETFNELIGHQH